MQTLECKVPVFIEYKCLKIFLEQDIELKVGKCFDKDAKFHFRLHMIQLSDVSTGKKETPFSRKPLHHTNISDESSEGPSIRKRYRNIRIQMIYRE
jgi:hypothetical protein